MTNKLLEYVDYIRNTGRVPLPIVMFDEDWEPIGPRVRADLVAAGLVAETEGGLHVLGQPAGVAALAMKHGASPTIARLMPRWRRAGLIRSICPLR